MATETRAYFYKISKWAFIMGAPNYLFEEIKIPKSIKIIKYILSKVFLILCPTLLVAEWAALWTQKNLNEKQMTDTITLSFSKTVLFSLSISFNYYAKDLRQLVFILTQKMKRVFNDEDVEREMIKRARLFSTLSVMVVCVMVLFYGVDAAMQVIFADGTFVTRVTAWPDVEDRSSLAGIVRIIVYLEFWVFAVRTSTVYVMVISVTVSLGHQYTQLCRYFDSLHEIFEGELLQEEKEYKYEEALKVGIDLHAKTLWCKSECQKIFAVSHGAQIVVNVTCLIVLLTQMAISERTIFNTFATLSTCSALLMSTGCLMWAAGDVTVQRPVVLTCLGVVNLSYSSYVSIVKTSYSVFSVLSAE